MKEDQSWRLPIAIFLGSIVLTWAWATVDEGACDLATRIVTADDPKKSVASCLEFWINRYQTLVGAAAAIFAALYAGWWVQKQLQTAHEQLRAATGDLEPDFAIEWRRDIASSPGELEAALLTVANRNRRDINIRRLELLEPRIPFAIYQYDHSKHPNSEALYGRELSGRFSNDHTSVELDFAVAGHRSSGEVPRARLLLMLASEGDDHRAGEDEPIQLKVNYDVYGSETARNEVVVRGLVRRRALPAR